MEEIGFDTSFSFIFSKRPGTPAANLPDDVSLERKKERLQLLQETLAHQANQYSNSFSRNTQNILVTGQAKKHKGQLAGRTECNRVVNFIGPSSLIGQFVDIDITETQPNSLRVV